MRSLIVLLVFLCFTSAGAAQRFYMGARLGQSRYDGVADAAPNNSFSPTLPNEISVNGLPFESDETAWGIFGGWYLKDWLALELGFNDLGNTGRETFAAFNGAGGISSTDAAVDVEEIYLASRFAVPLYGKWTANWTVGVTRTNFDATGAVPFLFFPAFSPPPPQQVVAYASPEDETGLVWGFGFGRDIGRYWSLDIGYRQHDTRVFTIDAFSVGTIVRF